ncbi:MAG TPA: histidine kinase [Chitinophagaceae bacterium]
MDHHLLIKTLLLLTLYAVACYALIYYLLPQFINRKWLKASAGSMLLFSFLLISSHLLYWNIFPFIDSSFNSVKPTRAVAWFWPAINLGLLNFAKIAAAAAIIKYIKYWWLKEKESQRLEREKINADLQLLKAQVHPDFLFKTLNNIYAHAQSSSPRTSGMLLKLSDLLSYMLYECDQQTVPLEKEIQMMKEYMQLEKIRHDDEPEIQVNIKGDLNGKSIAPFLLLPFIENSFKHCGQMTEQFWINMDIRIEEDNFSMKLTNGISEKMNDQELLNTDGLTNVQKRLTLLYPNDHELRITTEQEMSIVLLDIVLKDVTDIAFDEEEDDEPLNGRTNIIHALKYATD